MEVTYIILPLQRLYKYVGKIICRPFIENYNLNYVMDKLFLTQPYLINKLIERQQLVFC